MEKLTFNLQATSESPTKTKTESRGFTMIVDEPEHFGGTNQGASPVEYLLAAYAGCLNVVAHLIASEMKLDLEGLKIEITGDLNPGAFLGLSQEERPGFGGIQVVITTGATLPEDIATSWLEAIKARCPVGDNLLNHTPVAMTIVVK